MAYPKVFLEWEAATEARGKARGAKDKALSIILRQLNRRIGSLNQQPAILNSKSDGSESRS